LKTEPNKQAPPSRLKAYFEAVVFARHILGLEELQQVVVSRRCLGAASQKLQSCPRQADPFTVLQLKRLHEVLRDSDEVWDKAMAGMLLFCIYGRSRWADAQHAAEMVPDLDNSGELQSLELKTSVHKTARAFHLRHMFLPISAPAQGVTMDNWAMQWIRVRDMLQISDLSRFPLMPAPDRNLEPTRRPVSTQEAKLWLRHLLGDTALKEAKLTSHSCKCTCLSFLAKRGASIEDRLTLGYHSNKMRMALVYSRDAVARPLAVLSHVLKEIREGIFEPDNTRSGRLKPGAEPLDKVGVEPVQLHEPQASEQFGAESVSEQVSGSHEKQPVQPPLADADGLELDKEEDEGHVTTDSSDCSEGERQAWSPVVGHYVVDLPQDKHLWRNCNSKMIHLSHKDHVRVLLCGRRISESFARHDGAVRFDSAKCRICFRLKDS
jgi:hypothetical protein